MADFSSGFAGGFADSFTKMYTAQQALQMKREQMQRDQALEQQQQIQKNIDATMKLASDTIEAVRSRPDLGPDQAQAAINPLIESAAELGDHLRPGYGDLIRKQGAALIARPAKPTEGAYQPVTNPLSGEQRGFNRDTGQFTSPPPTSGSVGDIVPGSRTVTDIPAGAPAVPSSAPLPPNQVVAQNFPEGVAPKPAPSRETIAGMEYDTRKMLAERYLQVGESAFRNAFARGTPGAVQRTAVMNMAKDLAAESQLSGYDINRNTADFQANKSSLVKLTQMSTAVDTFEQTAVKNGNILIELANKVDQTGIPAIERWTRAGRVATGSADVSQFNQQITVWRAEMARILTNPTLGGVLTDSSRSEIEKAIQDGASTKQITKAVELANRDFANRRAAVDESRQKLLDRMGAKPVGTGAPQPAAAPQTPAAPKSDLQSLKEKYGLK